MPEFVEQLFGRAAARVGLRLEARKDGEHLLRDRARPAGARVATASQAVKRLGPPQDHYLKLDLPQGGAPARRARGCGAALARPPAVCRDDRGDARAPARRRRRRRAVHRAVGDGPVRDPLLHLRGARDGPARAARAGMGRARRRGRGRRRARARLPRRAARPHAVGLRAARARGARSRRGQTRDQPRARRGPDRRAPPRQRGARRAGAAALGLPARCRWTPSATRLQQRWSALEERVYRGEEAAKLARDEAERRLAGTRAPARGQAARVRGARHRPARTCAPTSAPRSSDRPVGRGSRRSRGRCARTPRSSSRRWSARMAAERDAGPGGRGRLPLPRRPRL